EMPGGEAASFGVFGAKASPSQRCSLSEKRQSLLKIVHLAAELLTSGDRAPFRPGWGRKSVQLLNSFWKTKLPRFCPAVIEKSGIALSEHAFIPRSGLVSCLQ